MARLDIIATNPEKNRSCRIQVKSRYATDFDGGFPISILITGAWSNHF